MKNNTLTLIEDVTSTGSGPTVKVAGASFNVHATAQTTSGSGSSVVVIEGSNLPNPSKNSDWLELGTITLSPDTNGASDGFPVAASYDKLRARVTTMSGTGNRLSVYVCEGR